MAEGITKNSLKFYWGTLIKGLLESKCDKCLGAGCPQCHDTGKMKFRFDIEGEHYEVPLWVFDSKGIHEFLKNISERFPKKHDGKPYSMSPNGSEPPNMSDILNYFEELELLAQYSGIYLEIAEDRRE